MGEWDDMLTPDKPLGERLSPQVCSLCRRERTARGMDAYDYNPMQAITGQPFGWYSGEDGEVCPECMEMSVRGRQQ